MRHGSQPGFTLLEVMVAVVLLAVGLSSLFTSQAGAIRIAQRAKATTVASLLARCKMAELEEKVLKEGLPANSTDGRDDCCEDAEHDGFTCEYKIERVVLPDQITSDEEGKDKMNGLAEAAKGGAAGSKSDPLAAIGIPLSGDPLSALSGLSASEGGSDPLAGMVLEFAFPIMKPLVEEQVRRASVIVRWKEGSSEQSFDVVQYLVNEAPFVPPEEDEDAEEKKTP